MNIITAIRTGKLFEAHELIHERLKTNMLKSVHGLCQPVMKETYGGPGAGVMEEDEIEFGDDDEDGKDKDVVESVLTEAKTREEWNAYLGQLHAGVAHMQAKIDLDRKQLTSMRKAGKDTSKKNTAIAKQIQALNKRKARVQDATKKFQEWMKKDAAQKQKAAQKKTTKPKS